jgi:N-acetyl-gamma-glutamyl-phosphate reductase
MSIRVAIVGPTGYTALYLLKLLVNHPEAEVSYLASHREQLPHIAEEFPELLGRCDLTCRPIDAEAIAREADVAFMCLPHVAAMQYVPDLLDAGLKVVDLSADYRLSDPVLYERVYGEPHRDPENLARAVYGLPELNGARIAAAELVANPGCYPTAAALGIGPLLARQVVEPTGIVINAASGVTGAGRAAKAHLHYPEMNESYLPYGIDNGPHRHQSEIEQTLAAFRGAAVQTLFVPHLLPVDRGILASIYMDPVDAGVEEEQVYEALEEAYANEPFVRVRVGFPNIKWVRDTNYCDLSARVLGGKVIVFAAEDNMIKGASGQAIQNMNLMFGLDEAAGLR